MVVTGPSRGKACQIDQDSVVKDLRYLLAMKDDLPGGH